ncbi:chaperonin 10-like protein [Microdochium bolleyi]|uniref:L-arabinitol 4-dehydrogenase n=1 Tax=Microdochium bolleyi TaxID=196109 RepID=A0A136ISN1_9PEZI|nr:chaperonin 10-like protein [Microdochium bolleyi]
MQNPSVVLRGPGQATIEDRPVPTITGDNDVIVKIAYTGVCGSDVHFWRAGGIRSFVSHEKPLVMGHEASGTIHEVGRAVTSLHPGDRVAIEPGVPCRACHSCRAGQYNLCSGMQFAADPGSATDGTLAQFFKTAADFCYKLPPSVELQEGVLVEPLAVAVHAVRQSGIREPGKKVVVFGAGTVGLFCAAVAKEFGAAQVVSVDVLASRLQTAQRLVGEESSRTWTPPSSGPGTMTPEDTAAKLKEECGLSGDGCGDAGGADVIMDATGAEFCVQTAIFTLRPGGTYVQVGMGKRKIDQFPIAEICEREITIKGCFRYGPGDFEIAMDLIARGRISLAGLVTGQYVFEKAWEAWESTGRGEGLKNVIAGPGEP